MDIINQLINLFTNSVFVSVIVALITAVLGPVALAWAKNKYNPKAKDTLKEAIDLNEAVDDQLETILDELKCGNVSVIQFHNGGHFYPTGKSIQKFSVFYERCAPNAVSISRDLQNVPASVFPKFLSEIYTEKYLEIHSFEGDNNIYDLDTFNVNYDAKSVYMWALTDLHDKLTAILYVGYTDKEHTLTPQEAYFINQKAGVIGTLLTKYLGK